MLCVQRTNKRQRRSSEGMGSGIPTKICAEPELRGNFWLPGKILLCKNYALCSALSLHRSRLKMFFLRLFAGHRAGYKEDISKTKSGYKVDTIISNL